MADGATYPAEMQEADGSTRVAGKIHFTDSDDQPSGPDNQVPFKPASGDVVVIAENAAGDDVLDYDDDSGRINVDAILHVTGNLIGDSDITGANVQAASLSVTGSAGFGSSGTDQLGFYGASTIAQPVVPLTTPLPQDIIDALVLLGLVSQSD